MPKKVRLRSHGDGRNSVHQISRFKQGPAVSYVEIPGARWGDRWRTVLTVHVTGDGAVDIIYRTPVYQGGKSLRLGTIDFDKGVIRK